MYTLLMFNNQGACEETSHATKAEIRRQIRTWNAKGMGARVIDNETGETIHQGTALSF